jgi:hypothetical protein
MTTDYGSDLSCVSDLTSELAEVSGRRLVSEAIALRLQTPRGRLLDDPNYGYDLTGFVNDDVSPSDVARIGASVEAECLKDERVISAVVALTFSAGLLAVSVLLSDADGPFTLVLAVGAVTVQIVSVGT